MNKIILIIPCLFICYGCTEKSVEPYNQREKIDLLDEEQQVEIKDEEVKVVEGALVQEQSEIEPYNQREEENFVDEEQVEVKDEEAKVVEGGALVQEQSEIEPYNQREEENFETDQVKNKVVEEGLSQKYEQEIEKSQMLINESKSALSNDPSYINEQCVEPNRGNKPDPFCDSRDSAKEFAIAYCVMPLGCDVATTLISDKLDSFSKKFIASEACSQTINHLQGNGYSPKDTLANLLESGVDNGCDKIDEDKHPFWKGVACVTSLAIKLKKIEALLNCIENEANSCIQKYESWLQAPRKAKELCEYHLERIATEKRKIDEIRSGYSQ